jgi:hypothetical protein
MGDCHSSDPGSNPGPGALSSFHIPTSIDYKNNKEDINSETYNNSIVQQKNDSSDKYKIVKLFENNQMRDLYNRKKKLDY